MTDPLIGTQVGNYRIAEKLGAGGMGSVYKAVHIELGNVLAIKVLGLGKAVGDKDRARFLNEAKALAALNHPNIVKVLDFVSQEGIYYTFMEYVEGKTLQDVLNEQDGPMPVEQAVQILAPIARALDYAHNRNIVHRDIKPSNIMITEDGRAMLTDFGIAKLAEATTVEVTRDGALVGTPTYMSPEQASAREVDGRADVYSLGVVLYRMVTGQAPFTGSMIEIIQQHATSEPPPPSSINPKLTRRQEKCILKALAKSPDERYQRAGDLIDALLATITNTGQIVIDRGSWQERLVESRAWGYFLRFVRALRSGLLGTLGFSIRLLLSISAGILVVATALIVFLSWIFGITLNNAIENTPWGFERMGVGHTIEYTFDEMANIFENGANLILPNTFSEFEVLPGASFEPVFYIKTGVGNLGLLIKMRVAVANQRPVIALENINGYPLPVVGYLITNPVNNAFDRILTQANANFASVGMDAANQTFTIVIDGPATQTTSAAQGVCKDGQDFSEDFSDIYSGWAQHYETAQAEVGYANGRYVLRSKDSNLIINQALPCRFLHFDASVLTQPMDDPGDAAWGLVFFETDPDNYWVFQINQMGWFSVEQVLNGEHTLMVPWTQTDSIQEDENRIRVQVSEESQGTFWINDVEVARLGIEDIPVSGGSFGLLLRSGQTPEVSVAFDDLAVSVGE